MLDRISLAFAGPNGMNQDLGLSATMFGFVVGIFTIGYMMFEVPAAGLATKAGSRRWIMQVLIAWGSIQCLIAFSPNAESMIVLRFLLGLAEAGFTPTVFFMLTTWFIRSYRPLTFVFIGFAHSLASILGPVLGVGMMALGAPFAQSGFHPWRFLLLGLGFLALLMLIPANRFLVEKPEDARWLTGEEKIAYRRLLGSDAEETNSHKQSVWQVVRNWKAWVAGVGYFGVTYAMFTLFFWTPTMVAGFQHRFNTNFSLLETSLLAGAPTLLGVGYALVASRVAGKQGRTGIVLVFSMALGAGGAIWTIFAKDPISLLAALSLVAAAGMSGSFYMPIVSRIFGGPGAFAAIAIVNTLGALSSFVSPIVTGMVIDATGSTNAGFIVIVVLLIMSALIALYAERLAKQNETERENLARSS
jgi:MFS family permease